MGGLILKLKPHEELMINGAVIQNGDRKTHIRVKTDGAKILRLRDAIRPEDATTPLKRACFLAQLAVAGQITNAEAAAMIADSLSECAAGSIGDNKAAISGLIAAGDFYQAMRSIGDLAAAEK